ncbi:TPA: hypothetical protein ACMDRZ_003038 [Vibrio cholerae]|uniref:Uncharacterized protein n=2 Tax=Vibrio vulnificus TaxID=672 RepID=A0AAI9ELV0_VIBVL|nr:MULTISPECIES: hypothetical protein [Vibrio]EKF9218963.1 hypothetical protein [Vibrio cholerae]OQK43786.1 hypothetical protein XM75_u0067 [Vibrio vulnificus]QKU65638.1 hypothetical protein HPY17_20180 [Vibrio cholerae]QKU69442.1 hypothetical protein HPY10_19830 [Vibrio cholerae]CDM12441.1 hypothetical protein [Vibrio vulnificus]
MHDTIIKLADVASVLKQRLPELVSGTIFDVLELEVEERSGMVVDYIINKVGTDYVLVIDDRDLTPELTTLEFDSIEAMVTYFERGERKPMVLDSVES